MTEKIDSLVKDPKRFKLGNVFENPGKFDLRFVIFIQCLIEVLHKLNLNEEANPKWLQVLAEDFEIDPRYSKEDVD